MVDNGGPAIRGVSEIDSSPREEMTYWRFRSSLLGIVRPACIRDGAPQLIPYCRQMNWICRIVRVAP
jgi:hypothetical protein